MDYQKLARKYILLNAIKHEGHAQLGPAMSTLFSEYPELKEEAKEIKDVFMFVITDINNLSLDDQIREVERDFSELLEVKEEKKEEGKLPPLPNVDKYEQIATRFAPAPSGALHISHLLRAISLSYLYAKMYDGKFVLRFEDTDPKRVDQKFYDWILEDLNAVEIQWDEIAYESDHFDLYLEKAAELIKDGKAYVDTCTQEEFKKYKMEQRNCPHRSLSRGENLERWTKMLDGFFAEGDAVVRLKTLMDHKNPVLRDPPLLRIIDTPHPRTGTKYRVYPLYNYACTIEDHYSNISHVFRAKEHQHNASIQAEIYASFGWTPPESTQFGMVYLPDPWGKIHKRQIRQWLNEGKISGWDDIRLPTIRAFLRRGFRPDAFKELAIASGLSKTDIRIGMETLDSFNRKLIDPIANRYFFVEDPVELIIEKVPQLTKIAQIPLHPEFPERGNRELKVVVVKNKANIYVAKTDAQQFIEQELVRLKDLFNIVIEKVDSLQACFHSREVDLVLKKKKKIIHWLPISRDLVKTSLLMSDGSVRTGFSEPATRTLKIGDIIQFERVGFGRVDQIGAELVVWFAHK